MVCACACVVRGGVGECLSRAEEGGGVPSKISNAGQKAAVLMIKHLVEADRVEGEGDVHETDRADA